MGVETWRVQFNDDEKHALGVRVDQLKMSYTADEIVRIICSELDSAGMRSEQHYRLLDVVLRDAL